MAKPKKEAQLIEERNEVAKSYNLDLSSRLSKFDYNNLQGEEFFAYNELIDELDLNKSFDFEEYRVEQITKVRYKGIKDSPVDVIGIRIKDNKPIKITRIAVKHAIANNGFLKVEDDLKTIEGAQFTHNNRYYLLKK